MQKWEYQLIDGSLGKDIMEEDGTQILLDLLNELGKEGWEAVGFNADTALAPPGSPRPTFILLKRPLS